MITPIGFVCVRGRNVQMRAAPGIDLRDVLAGRPPIDWDERIPVRMHYGKAVRELQIARRFLTPEQFELNSALTMVEGADGVMWRRG